MKYIFRATTSLMVLFCAYCLCFGSNIHVQAAVLVAPRADGKPLTGYASPQFNSKQDAYIDSSGAVRELSIIAGNAWHYADLTALIGTAVAYGLSLIGFDSPQFQSKQYAYVDNNRSVEELYYIQGTGWHGANLSLIV